MRAGEVWQLDVENTHALNLMPVHHNLPRNGAVQAQECRVTRVSADVVALLMGACDLRVTSNATVEALLKVFRVNHGAVGVGVVGRRVSGRSQGRRIRAVATAETPVLLPLRALPAPASPVGVVGKAGSPRGGWHRWAGAVGVGCYCWGRGTTASGSSEQANGCPVATTGKETGAAGCVSPPQARASGTGIGPDGQPDLTSGAGESGGRTEGERRSERGGERRPSREER